MSISFKETGIKDLYIVTAHQVTDDRGCLIKYLDKDIFMEKEITSDFCEAAVIISNKGVLRGLHYQTSPAQARLIYVISGKIFNVSLDLRSDSHTFGKYENFYLPQGTAILVPGDFANGFLAMEDNTIISCHYASKFIGENNSGILWNDPDLNIPWPLEELNCKLLISKKDSALQTYKQYIKNQEN